MAWKQAAWNVDPMANLAWKQAAWNVAREVELEDDTSPFVNVSQWHLQETRAWVQVSLPFTHHTPNIHTRLLEHTA